MANKLSLNVAKTEFLLIGSKPMMKGISDSELSIKIDNIYLLRKFKNAQV